MSYMSRKRHWEHFASACEQVTAYDRDNLVSSFQGYSDTIEGVSIRGPQIEGNKGYECLLLIPITVLQDCLQHRPHGPASQQTVAYPWKFPLFLTNPTSTSVKNTPSSPAANIRKKAIHYWNRFYGSQIAKRSLPNLAVRRPKTDFIAVFSASRGRHDLRSATLLVLNKLMDLETPPPPSVQWLAYGLSGYLRSNILYCGILAKHAAPPPSGRHRDSCGGGHVVFATRRLVRAGCGNE